jgi:hypothetical protein
LSGWCRSACFWYARLISTGVAAQRTSCRPRSAYRSCFASSLSFFLRRLPSWRHRTLHVQGTSSRDQPALATADCRSHAGPFTAPPGPRVCWIEGSTASYERSRTHADRASADGDQHSSRLTLQMWFKTSVIPTVPRDNVHLMQHHGRMGARSKAATATGATGRRRGGRAGDAHSRK